MRQLLLLKLVCLCMHGKVRQMRSTSGVLNRSVTLLRNLDVHCITNHYIMC